MSRINPFGGTNRGLTRLWQGDVGEHVIALAWSPTGGQLAAATVSGPIVLFEALRGVRRGALAGHDFGTCMAAWSRDGAHFASAGQDGHVKLWDTATGAERHKLPGGSLWVERLAWCPTADLLLSAAGKKLRLWQPDGQLVREYPDHVKTIADVQWQPKTQEFASTTYGEVSFWQADSSAALRTLHWRGSMLALAWSPDGKYLAAGSQDATVHFWQVKTGQDLEMSGYPRKVCELAWDSGSRYLATGGGPLVTVWSCAGKGPAGTTPLQLDAHREHVTTLAFQREGPLLLSGGADGLVALWQPGKSQQSVAMHKQASGITQLAWSPSDKLIAVGTEAGGVAVLGMS